MPDFQHVSHAVTREITHYRLSVRNPIAVLAKSCSGAIPGAHDGAAIRSYPARHDVSATITIRIRQLVRCSRLPYTQHRSRTLGIRSSLRIRIPHTGDSLTLPVLPDLH
ncbi:hypothetical protein S2091_4718 [Solimicrobium silvestre]|uniref:Uncharacterized protein n=1 Tax=Solimicrobium silvestre TaxID=2099400 RepID=A0A2S9GS70_9BURK|nr:hypothetical protein S2091_4718 [Solimicrobium silvestre]